ncbi:F-box protein At1g11270-like [Bidens hawaiensis]|uniref:F-box protein At1g11270-like n=1 Tax=Bidens hawaiensis TaxID=980011 RepID=UPI00404A8FF4
MDKCGSHLKSLLQFRTVSKQWKSVIDSSRFITSHGVNQTQSHLLLLAFGIDFEDKFVSIVDDDVTLSHHHKLSPPINIPIFRAAMLGCCRGLVCLSAFDPQSQKDLVFVWNPSIRKCVGITIPSKSYSYELGFGVCPITNDPKLVRLTSETDTDHKAADVFALSSGVWRSVPMNLHWPCKEMHFSPYHVVIDTVIHWVAYDRITDSHHVIVSFDLSTEEFEEVDLSLALPHPIILSISKLNGSLVVLDLNPGAMVCDVWMMIKNGGSKSSFTKLFTVSFNPTPETMCYRIIGFRKNGEPMVGHMRQLDEVIQTTLEVCDTNSKQLNEVETGISCRTSFSMASYTESLLLLNHSDSIIHS